MSNELQGDSRLGVEGGSGNILREVDDYEILERIGRGGMGEVFVARQVRLKRLVAIKFLLEEDGADSKSDLIRFRREAELMAKVSHPNVLSIFDFGDIDGRPYLVMEYVEGGDLRRQMTPGRPMSQQKVRSVVMPVGEALDYLHRYGIIHRDLKPENILLHDGNNPRVTDFGVAVLRAGSGAITRPTQGVGTLGYVAPEQQYRLKVDERADQYSLAALAYEMLTGQLPLGVFKAPSALNPLLSPAVDATIMRALQENPKSRFPTIREFTAALDQSLAPETRRRPPYATWAVAASLAIGLALLGLKEWRPFSKPEASGSHGTDLAPLREVPVRPAVERPIQKSSPLIEELTRLWAYKDWERRGKPEGEPKDVKEANWFKAKGKVEDELHRIAYKLWVDEGRPEKEEGRRVEPLNWEKAQHMLYETLAGNGISLFNPPEDGPDESP